MVKREGYSLYTRTTKKESERLSNTTVRKLENGSNIYSLS